LNLFLNFTTQLTEESLDTVYRRTEGQTWRA